MSSHAENGHGTTSAEVKHSPFYRTIMISIFVLFSILAAGILIYQFTSGSERGKAYHHVVLERTTLTSNTSVRLSEVVSPGHHCFYTLEPSVALTVHAEIARQYSFNYPDGQTLIDIVDDQGSHQGVRDSSAYVTFTNYNKKPVGLGIGCCPTSEPCNYDFNNTANEVYPGGGDTVSYDESSRNPVTTTFGWVLFLVIVYLVYYLGGWIVAKNKPEFWVRWPFEDDEEYKARKKHSKHGHGKHEDGGHHTASNGYNNDFFFKLVLVFMFAVTALIALAGYDGVEKLYSLVPAFGFAWFTYLVYYHSVSVDAHTKKGIYFGGSNHEVETFEQGDASAPTHLYSIGIPSGQGTPDLNMDKRLIELDVKDKPELATMIFQGGDFATLQLFEATIYVPEDADTEWLTRFRIKTIDDLDTLIKRIAWGAAALAAEDTTIDDLLKKTRDSHNGTEVSIFKFCKKVDDIVKEKFKAAGIELVFRCGMAQPKPLAELGLTMQLESRLRRAKQAISKEYPELKGAQLEKATRLYLNISTENYNVIGFDSPTMDRAVALAQDWIKTKAA